MKTITAKSFRNVLFVLLLLTGKFSQAQGSGSIGSLGNIINDPCPKADIYDRQAYCGQMQLGGLIFQTTIPVVSYYWSTTGTGTFVPAYNVQNATYVFSHADSVAGSVTILFNVQGALNCLSVASVNLTINNSNPLNDNDPCTADVCNSTNGTVTHTPIPNCGGCLNPPTATAGGPYSTSCAGVQLNGTFGGSATGGTWTSTGTGSFIPNATTANASYLPSPGDLASGTPKTLTFTSNNPNGAPCIPATSSTTINFTSLSDNNPCTLDQCDNGVIVHAQVLDGSPGASDNNQCTNDICISGNTVHNPQSGPTAQDGNPCTLEICVAGVLQSNPTNLSVSATSTATSNCLNNGTATATPTGGVAGPYSYLWTPGSQTTQTATNLAPNTYTVRVTDNNGCTATTSVIVGAGAGSIAAPVITGPLTVCRNQTFTYSIVAVPGATSYNWTFPTRATGVVAPGGLSASVAYTGGPGGPFPSPTPSHNQICVTAVGPCGTNQSCITIGLGTIPAPVITGPTTVCPTQTFTYSIVAVPGATSYNWTFPTRSTHVTAANGLSTVVTFNSNFPSPTLSHNTICVTAVGPCGSSPQTCIQITKGLQTAPVITGPILVCRNLTYNYSIVPIPGATSYTWEFPTRATGIVAPGGLSASVAYTGGPGGQFPSPNPSSNDICVTANGPCGNNQTCVIIGLDPNCPPCVNPAPPVISGPTTVCPTQTFTYTIAADPNATSYNWTFPTRSTHVTAANGLSTVVTYNSNFPSPTLSHNTICVTAVGPCGSSPQVCIQISKGLQTAPVITGPILVCRNQTYSYSIVAVPGATSYTWEFPTRATGTVAGNGLSASVAYNGGPGGQFPSPNPSSNDICVTANGPCGNSQTCVIIGLDPTCPSTCANPPTANANTTGTPYSACGTTPSASTVSLHGSVGGSATGGTWSAPAGTGSFSNPNNLNTTFTPSQTAINSGSVTLTLTSNNPSGAPCVAATSTAVVTFNALPPTPLTITGPQVVCPGSTVQYCITIPPGSNTSAFHWWIDRTANPSLSFNPQGQPVKIDTVIAIVPGQTSICINVYVPIGYTGGANGQEVEVETLNGPCASANHKEIDDIFGGNNADDGNACTIDGCNSVTGSVTHTPVNTNDGNACTIDACNSTNGTITHIAAEGINDNNACTLDACNSISGSITHTASNIDDNNPCTNDACNSSNGSVTHNPVSVDDNNPCTLDACNSSNGSITHTGISADDGNACTNDFCNPATGSVTHTPVAVTDFNECTTDICNTQSGVITHPPAPGVSDGNPCTQDVCVSTTGAVSHPLVDVNDGNACTTDYCEVPSGSIYHLTNYNDNNACTDDFCNTLSGAQTHPIKAGVDDGNACTTDNCNSLTGITLHPALPDGSDGASDGNACTEDKCLSGQTVHTPLPAINDNNICTTDACNTSSGSVTHTNVANGSPGDSDGNACTSDVCQSGVTTHPPLAGIEDNNACTNDVCNTGTGAITHNPIAGISDGNLCTEDICNTLTGVITNPLVNVNDGNGCTDDYCEVPTGSIYHLTNYNDNNACTDDFCNTLTGSQTHPTKASVSDGNLCTEDVCNTLSGITTHPAVAGINDGNACTNDACNSTSGSITHTPKSEIEDNNACTNDACDTNSGSVTHTPLVGIDDSNACTNDACNTVSGSVTHTPKAEIEDNNACTNDACNTISGSVTHTPLVGIDDSNACTNDACNTVSGSVTHTPKAEIEDNNACTNDACNTISGSVTHSNVIVYIPGTINITGGGSNASNICLNGSTSRTFDISPTQGGLTLNWKVNDVNASPTTGTGSNFNSDFASVVVSQPPGIKVVSVIAFYTDANGCKSDSQQTNVLLFLTCPPAIVSVDNSGNAYTVGSNLTKVGKTNSLEGKNLSMVSLYPNPTSGNATLSFNATNSGKYNISIYDMFGRVLVNEDMQAEEGINTKDFNLENVAKGIYFVNILSTIDKEVQTLRLVVE